MTFQGQAVSKALETLREIQEQLKNLEQVYGGALLFEDDETVQQHVSKSIEALEEAFPGFAKWKDVSCPYCVQRIGRASSTCEDCMGRGKIRRITG